MATLIDLQNLKQRIENARQESSRAQGALEQIMKRLRDEHDCDSLDVAKKKLKRLEKEVQDTEALFNQQLADFKEKYEEMLP